jgi:lipopolysaccharide heptosyltransferase I
VPDPQRILFIRPSALGDVCRSVGVVAALKRRYPDARIDWLVQNSFTQAIEHHPAVDRVIPFNRKALGKQIKKGKLKPVREWLGTLRSAEYDLAIDAQGLARSGFFAWCTRASRRVGYKDAQELSWMFLNERVEAPRTMHTVDRMMRLADALDADSSHPDLRLHTDPDDLSQVIMEYPDRYAVIAPTSRWAGKCWPIDRYTELARTLVTNPNLGRVIIAGGPGERLQCAPLLELAENHPKIVDRVGSTSISQLMAIISRAKLVVANDSAALHMAVGFDRPLVALLGPTEPALVGPYKRDADVIRQVHEDDDFDVKKPDSSQVMERITLDEVIEACGSRLVAPVISTHKKTAPAGG